MNETGKIKGIAPKNGPITDGTFVTPTGCRIRVRDDGGRCYPVELKVGDDWWAARDLRAAAKLFNRMAAALERDGRD